VQRVNVSINGTSDRTESNKRWWKTFLGDMLW